MHLAFLFLPDPRRFLCVLVAHEEMPRMWGLPPPGALVALSIH
jgi:hypothetical protein